MSARQEEAIKLMRKFFLGVFVAVVFTGCAAETEVEVIRRPKDVTTTTVDWADPKVPLIFDTNVPDDVEQQVRETFELGFDLGYTTRCTVVEISIDHDMEDELGGQAVWWTDYRIPCTIDYHPKSLDGTFLEDVTVRHEVAHIFTTDEEIDHGPRFREVEAKLYAPKGIQVFYFLDGTYPDCFKVDTKRGLAWARYSDKHCVEDHEYLLDLVP
jgi:hypothetical protein